jgi:16S rRNA (guanine527-N7)-methyltransferase
MRRRRTTWGDERRSDRDHSPRLGYLSADLSALADSIRPYGIHIDPIAQERFLLLARELLSWNMRLNLLSRADAPNVIRKHVAASLGVVLVATPNNKDNWIDVGTGAGFPGLILKVLCPEMEMTLVDSARKRCLFLENVIRRMELGRVPVLPARVETMIARGEGLSMYSVLTARAVASLDETIRSFGTLVRPGGRIITFKGPSWDVEVEAATSSGVLGPGRYLMESVTRIPWTAGHLLVLKKEAGL